MGNDHLCGQQSSRILTDAVIANELAYLCCLSFFVRLECTKLRLSAVEGWNGLRANLRRSAGVSGAPQDVSLAEASMFESLGPVLYSKFFVQAELE
jgi:hypothetical protein